MYVCINMLCSIVSIVKILVSKKENSEFKKMIKYIKKTHNNNLLTGKSKKDIIFWYNC